MGVQTFHPAERLDRIQRILQVGSGKGDDTGAFTEVVRGQSGKHGRGTSGREHVTGPGHEITGTFRSPGADKYRAGIAHFFNQLRGSRTMISRCSGANRLHNSIP